MQSLGLGDFRENFTEILHYRKRRKKKVLMIQSKEHRENTKYSIKRKAAPNRNENDL